MQSNGYNVYKNNSVNYASKDQLLLMLLDGAVKFAKIAELALNENDVKKTHENLIKTQNIFIELIASLDTGAGEWAEQLSRVYRFINEKLVETNMKKDVKILQEIIPLIQDIRDIWYEAQRKNKILV